MGPRAFMNAILQRAKTLLEIETVREGFDKGSVWKWSLPRRRSKTSKMISLKRLKTWKKMIIYYWI